MALLTYSVFIQVCLVDIAKNGSDVAADLNKQYSGSKVDYAHCDVTDYDKFKGTYYESSPGESFNQNLPSRLLSEGDRLEISVIDASIYMLSQQFENKFF